jgi:inner membrane protein
MDNVTHALAGCLFGATTVALAERRLGAPSPAFRRVAFTMGVLTAELPDVDLFYSTESLGMGKLGYLLHHRGHTHTVAFAVVSAFLVWGLVLALRRDLRGPPRSRPLLALSLTGTLSHVVLDWTNSYGVHPWWPLDNRWTYGDAVFIIEPWLWIAALVPLLLTARALPTRAVYVLLLGAILVAAWRVDLVVRETATVLTIGAVLWTALVWAVPSPRRVTLGLVAWLGLEAMFFTASVAGKRAVAREVGPDLHDAVLSPPPGNPLCLWALVVTEEAGTYHVANATVAPFPGIRSAAACAPSARRVIDGPRAGRRDSPAISWGGSWSAPVSELRELAATNCEIAAALQFMRVPGWRRLADGGIEFFDWRYGEGSFASITTRAKPGRCPRFVPPWEWAVALEIRESSVEIR